MPQAKTPKPESLAVPWAMPDPVIPLHSCQPAPDLQAHKISVAVLCSLHVKSLMLLAVWEKSRTGSIYEWPSHASRPSLKKMARKSKPCSSVPTLLRATCCYNTSSKVWIRTSQIMRPKHYLEQYDAAAFISTLKQRDMMDYYGKHVLDNLQPPVLSWMMKRKGIRIKRRPKGKEKEKEGFALLRNNLIFIPRY